MILRFCLLLYLWSGMAVYTLGAGGQTSKVSTAPNVVVMGNGLRLQDRFEYGNAGLSVLEGVVTYADANRRLVVLQAGEQVYVLRLTQANELLKVCESVKMECELAPNLTMLPSFPNQPAGCEIIDLFEAPSDWGDFFLSRMRGYLHPPATGDYTFWIASDDSSELWLSDTTDPRGARRMAGVPEGRFTSSREWTRTSVQQSKPVRLEAGRAYYIEALHQDTRGKDCLAVAWQGPGFERAVIEGKNLSPWPISGRTNDIGQRGILWEAWTNFYTTDLSVLSEEPDGVLKCNSMRILRREPGALPSALQIQTDEPVDSKAKFRWVELEGEIQFMARDGEWLNLELKHGDARIVGRVKTAMDLGAALPVKSVVRAKGFFEPVRSPVRDVSEGTLWVDRVEDIQWDDSEANWAVVPVLPQYLLQPDNSELAVGRVIRLQGRVVAEESPGVWRFHGKDTFFAHGSMDGTNWMTLGVPIEVQFKNILQAGIAVASFATGEVAEVRFNQVAGLVENLRGTNIGEPQIGGSFDFKNGTFIVKGSGQDIWRQSDQGFFAYQSKPGGAQIIAHLEGIKSADAKAKAVVMFRESLDADAAWAGVAMAPNHRLGLQWRPVKGNSALGLMENRTDGWIKLVRQQNEFLVKAGTNALPSGQDLEILGRLGWEGQTPMLNDVRFRLVPNTPGALTSFAPAGTSSETLRLSQIRSISVETANALSAGSRSTLRTRVGGVVTFAGQVGAEWLCFVQDQSGGARVQPAWEVLKDQLWVGDWVEIVGVPALAVGAPEILASGVANHGKATYPEAAVLPHELSGDSSLDAQWVEVEGVVRSTTPDGRLQLMTRVGQVEAFLNSGFKDEYLDSRIRVRGVFWRMPGPTLLLPSANCIEVIEASPKDAFGVPLFSIAAVVTNRISPSTDRRLKVVGVVTCLRDDFLMVQDETAGMRLDIAGQTNLHIGDRVEAVGFPNLRPTGVSLVEVILRRTSAEQEPKPIQPALEGIIQLKNSARLVSIEVVLIAQHPGDKVQTLDVQSGQRVFRAVLPKNQGKIPRIAAGSQLRLTGVMIAERGDVSPSAASAKAATLVGSVEMLLRSPQDVVVIKSPPWWNWKHTVATVGIVFMVLAGAVIWIRTLGKKVEDRTAELRHTMGKLQRETRISATLAERDRLAGEIHDSVEQGLSAIMMQMEAATKLVDQPEEIRRYLKMAKNMAGHSRAEVQHAVWDLQSPLLENSDLVTALRRVAQDIGAGDSPLVELEVEGAVITLASTVEHHLLRIAQEAITNAVKHGNARHILLKLAYTPDAARLLIRDDGAGFNPEAFKVDGGHFGLHGMQLRARKIGAEFQLQSAPGQGTCIQVSVPLEHPLSDNPAQLSND